MTLAEILQKAKDEHWAVPHFNVANIEMLKAVAEAAREKKSPALVGVSENERLFIGMKQSVALIKLFAQEYGVLLFLNADHTHDVALARDAIDAGFDSVHIDLSKKPLEENLAGTREVVEYARARDANISVEGEIGYIVTDSSKVYEGNVDVPESSLTKPEEAKNFVEQTGVSRLAPAIGSIHGIAANAPHLDMPRINELSGGLPRGVALTLHGGSGVPKDQVVEAIKNGVTNVHISTDLRVAYAETLKTELAKGGIAPYKIMAPVINAIKKVCAENMELFGSANRA